MLLKGRGGVGKTVVLLQLAYRAFTDQQRRSLVLTFNKALVADLRRTMALMGVPRNLENGGIGIETVHGFIGRLMISLGIIDSYNDFLEHYSEHKATLLDYFSSGTIKPDDIQAVKSKHTEDFDWDLIFVDEGQDWPSDEIAILRYLYNPEQITISDGVDQFVRESVADWTSGTTASVKVRKLTQCMRMKANIAAVIGDIAQKLSIENWDLNPNLEATGGRIIVVEGDLSARPDLIQIWAGEARDLGNYPVDLLACVPPAMVDRKSANKFCEPAAALEAAGLDIWDGTAADIRQNYPTRREQLRFVQYDSCRGLEGWSVFAYRLDQLWEYKFNQLVTLGNAIDPLLTSVESEAHAHAARWLMIPLTRAIDTLVINVGEDETKIKSMLRSVAKMRSDCVEWIALGAEGHE